MSTTATKTIQRHTVVADAEANGWVRLFACPGYDVFTRGTTEIAVDYFDSGRVRAGVISNVGEASGVPTTPGNKMAQINAWLTAAGE